MIQEILFRLPGVIVGFAMHEFAHAIVAHKLGDPTPERDGRLTLSPKAHLDPLGTILIAITGFGWAKPVVTHPGYFANPKRDNMLVSLAGPLMNVLVAAGFILILKILQIVDFSSVVGQSVFIITASMLFYSAKINVFLAVFNMLPLAPLDGFSVLAGIIPAKYYRNIEVLATHGQTILMFLILASFAVPEIIGHIFNKPTDIILGTIYYIINLIPG